jgi:hypothetical protein
MGVGRLRDEYVAKQIGTERGIGDSRTTSNSLGIRSEPMQNHAALGAKLLSHETTPAL